ncbi:MAG TPA: SDR family NAD(P)-dependent oxidoreductase [Bryobacteraceae bacterium]|nr:SDR family NAD(P)-dependent oxidoreductase [Bryobacteraceae bacterium]
MGKLQGQVAVITGGTEGIGLATTRLFVSEGAYVFITGRRQKELDEAVKTIGSNAAGVQGDVAKLEDELREYDEIKSGELTLPHVERLDQIAPFVAKMRIAKGVSQTELARRLGVSKQVVSRYEETEYQTVAIPRLQEILDAIGIKALVTLSA